MANRIIEGIEKAKKNLDARIANGTVTVDEVKEFDKELDMDFDMYSDFQTRKSLASVDGRLTLDEAQTIYSMIGNTPSTFNALPTHTKGVLTQVYASLLKP